MGCAGRDDGSTSDNSILVQILIPVLVGSGLLVLVLIAIGIAAWFLWKKRANDRRYQSSTSMINFADSAEQAL
jgi:cbb3-type cytochrome oxidase subunit 3